MPSQNGSLNTFLRILPLGFLGIISTISTDFGVLYPAINFLENSIRLKGIYNLVSGKSVSINQIVKILVKETNYKIKKKKLKKRIEEIGSPNLSAQKGKSSYVKPLNTLKIGILKTIKFYEKNRKFL